jgi:hypothetical protein
MAGASLLQVTDIKRLFSPGCHQHLQESNFPPHLGFLNLSRGSCEQSGRQSSRRSSIRSSSGLRPGARTAANVASCRIEHQKASKESMAADSPPGDSESTSDSVDPHMGTRRTALLVGSSLLLSGLTTSIAGRREAQAAVSKPPYVEEVPDFVKGELRRLL